MTTINTSDLAIALPALLDRIRQGETVFLLENGTPVAKLTSPEGWVGSPADTDDEPWWRGVFAPPLPVKVLPTVTGTTAPVVLERHAAPSDPSWYRNYDADE